MVEPVRRDVEYAPLSDGAMLQRPQELSRFQVTVRIAASREKGRGSVAEAEDAGEGGGGGGAAAAPAAAAVGDDAQRVLTSKE